MPRIGSPLSAPCILDNATSQQLLKRSDSNAHFSGIPEHSLRPVSGSLYFPFPFPFLAPFGEDAVEKLGAGFIVPAFLAGEFGFGGDEFAFAGGFEEAAR